MNKWSIVAGGLTMCCLVSDSQAVEAENAFVKVSADTPVYRLEQKGEKDFNAYCSSTAPATFSVAAQPTNWVLVAPASGSLAVTPGTSGVWKVKSQLGEDKPEGKIYLWNYFIEADGYNAKDITVPFGKEVKYFSYEGLNTVNSDWDVSGFDKNDQNSNTYKIIFNRDWWDITEWFTESYPTPQPGVYKIKANLTGNPSVTDTGVMTVVDAEFTENESHPYGFDDYTNWSLGPPDYYGDRKGHCTLPYASVHAGNQGMAYLTVDPTSNTKEIQISSSASENDLALNPETTVTTTDFGFTPASSWFPQTATVTAKMDDANLAKLEIVSYKKKNYTCLIVNVIKHSTDTTPPLHSSATKYNDVFKQAIIEFSVSIHDQPFVYQLPNQNGGAWKEADIHALKNAFCSANPLLVSTYNFIVFNLYDIAEDVFVNGTGYINGTFSFLYAGMLMNDPNLLTAPHEMGHNFGLYDLYTKNNSIPIRDPDADNLMNAPCCSKLRTSQWTTIRATHQNIGD